tara:strand:+ start:3227 stop:4465 length:1239 start_codon:yes stop_codon:yes gene_type:complete
MKIKNYEIEILISTLVLVLLFYSSNPVFYSDSSRYLNGSLNDPPLYSIIITLMQSIFTTLNSIIILQTFLVGFGIAFFTKNISKYFNLNIATKIIVTIFLFLPILEFYNHLLTEALGYAFSIFFVSFVLRLIYNFNIQNLVLSSVFVIALLLIRNQFIFLYPVILLLYLGIIFIHKSKKKLILLTISFISIFLIHNSLISLNKYIKQGSLENKALVDNNVGPFNFIFIDSIYISSIQDIEIFKDENLKKTLAKIFQEIEEQKASLKHYNGRGHFGLSLPIIKSQSNFLLKDLAIQKNATIASLKKEISIKLLKVNSKKYIKFLFKKFYDSAWLFVFLPFFMILAASISFLKEKSNFSLFIVFLSSFVLANHSVVYLFGRVQPRYFIYTDFILLMFVYIIFTLLFNKKVKDLS